MKMELFLVRHAIAIERAPGLDDRERPLTRRGARRFERCVAGLARLDIALDHVFHSPWRRAVETAELLAPITHGARDSTDLLIDRPDHRLLALAGLFPARPLAPPDEHGSTTRQPDAGLCIAFVGHEPWMAELLSLCLFGSTEQASKLPFKKGGVAWLHGTPEPGHLKLRALLPPRALRRLAAP